MSPKDKKDPNLWKDDDYDFLDYLDSRSVMSATDCTGLIPTPPQNEAESKAYAQLNTIPDPPTNKPKDNEK